MAEPAFYKCRGCSRAWERMEPKWGPSGPKICPHCGAGSEMQTTNQSREDAYVRDVYGPVATALFGAPAPAAAKNNHVKLREELTDIRRSLGPYIALAKQSSEPHHLNEAGLARLLDRVVDVIGRVIDELPAK